MKSFETYKHNNNNMDVPNKCRKFEPNIFNKSKCQNCFRGKEDHSAEALEGSRNSRKVCLYGYLFVAPDSFDFTSQLDRTKRWQRRFFVLYDSGDLSYSVDENVGTIPQCVIDMNQCSDVFSAYEYTGHQYSIGIKVHEKNTYIKGTSKEEINRWQELLAVYPQNLKSQRPRKYLPSAPAIHDLPSEVDLDVANEADDDSAFVAMNNRVNVPNKRLSLYAPYDPSDGVSVSAKTAAPRTTSYVLTGSQQQQQILQKKGMESQNSIPSSSTRIKPPTGGTEKQPQAYRGVRNMKHKNEKSYVDNLRKSSSLQNLSGGGGGRGSEEPMERSSSNERLTKQIAQESTVSRVNVYFPISLHGSYPSLRMTSGACPSPVTTSRHTRTNYKDYAVPPSQTRSFKDADFRSGTGELLRRVLVRPKSSTNLELEKFSNTNIVSNVAWFWEQVSLDSERDTADLWLQSVSQELPSGDWRSGENQRSRHVSSSPFRNRQPLREPDRCRSRSRTQTVSPGRASIRSLNGSSSERKEQVARRRSEITTGSDVLPGGGLAFDDRCRNKTDEFKISMNSPDVVPINVTSPNPRTYSTEVDDLMYVKKGWLLKQAVDKSWQKTWCVLTSNTLTYYQDSKRVESIDNIEGVIILTPDTKLTELDIPKNIAFKISNKTNEYVMSAMTNGIRSSWMQAVRRCVAPPSDSPTQDDMSSSLDSTSTTTTMPLWKSPCRSSDSDADVEVKSRISFSSSAFKPVRLEEPVAVSPNHPRIKLSSAWPYRSTSAANASTDGGRRDSSSSESSTTMRGRDEVEGARPSIVRSAAIDRGTKKKSPERYDDLSTRTDYTSSISEFASGGSRNLTRRIDAEKEIEAVDGKSIPTTEKSVFSPALPVLSGSSYKAPSTKVKERSRAKSPKRVKSPPPDVERLSSIGSDLSDRMQMRTTKPDEILRVQLQNSPEKTFLQQLEYEVAALTKQLDFTRSQLEETLSMNDNLRSKLVKVSQEQQNAREEIELDQKANVTRLQTKLMEASSLIESQNTELLELRRNKNERTAVMDRHGRMETEKEEAMRELAEKNGMISKLRRELAEKESELRRLEESWIGKMEESKSGSSKEREKMEMKLEELENRLNEAVQASETNSVESLNSANILRDRESVIRDLTERVSGSETKLERTSRELEVEMEENNRMQRELDEYCSENAVLKTKLAVEAEKRGELEADVRHIREERMEMTAATVEKDTKNVLLRQDVERVERQSMSLKEEKTHLFEDLRVQREKAEQLRRELRSNVEEMEKLRDELDKKTSTTEAETERRKAEEKIRNLEEMEREREIVNAAIPLEEFERTKEDNEELRGELIALREMMDKTTAERETERKDAEEMKVEKEKKILQVQCEFGELVEQQKLLKKELEQTQTKKTALEREQTALKERLGVELEKKCKEMKENQSKMKELERQLEEKKKAIASEGGGGADARGSFDLKVEEICDRDLKEKYTFLARQVKRLQMEQKQAVSRSEELETMNRQLKQEQRAAEVSRVEELETLNLKVQDLTTKLNRVERRNCRLERLKSEDSTVESSEDVLDGDRKIRSEGHRSSIDEAFPRPEESIVDSLHGENETLARQVQTREQQEERSIVENEEFLKQTETSKSRDDKNEEMDDETRSVGEDEKYASIVALLADKEKTLLELEQFVQELESELARKEGAYHQEIEAQRTGYEIRLRSLRDDLSAGRSDLADSLKENDDGVHRLETRLANLEEELRSARTERDRIKEDMIERTEFYEERLRKQNDELGLVYREIETDGKNGERLESGKQISELQSEIVRIKKLLSDVQMQHSMELNRLQKDPNVDPSVASQIDSSIRIRQLEMQIQDMQSDYEHELAMQRASHRRELMNSKDDVMQLLAAAEANSIPIDEESIRKTYVKEVEQIKDMYDKGFSAMEKSHQRTMMEMRRNHKHELDRLRQEKDQLLNEEAQATQAALDAMRKAQDSELQKERNKFLDLIAKTYSHADMESLQRQHEDDLELIQYEIRQLSEQYSVKCLENAALNERLETQTKTLHESRKRVQDVLARNDELNSRLKFEVERLNRTIENQTVRVERDANGESSDVNKVALQVKQVEVIQLQEELENTRLQLHVKIEDLKECQEKYHVVCEELQQRKQQTKRRGQSDQSDEALENAGSQLGYSSSSSSRVSIDRFEEKCDPSEANDRLTSTPEQNQDDASGDFDVDLRDLRRSNAESDLLASDSSRRSFWRFKNPQRARSNPGTSKSSLLQKSTSVDSDQTTQLPTTKKSSIPSVSSSTSAFDDSEVVGETSPNQML